MTRRDVKKSGATLAYEVYGYDLVNRLISTTRNDGKNDSFGYYLDGELNSAQYTDGGNPAGSADYTLDKAGNRLSVNYSGNTKTYTPNVINQYSVAEDAGG